MADALTQATPGRRRLHRRPADARGGDRGRRFSAAHAPLLALNFLPAERPAPARFYQYALSPEDEARLAARRILEDHHRHGVALVPAGDWGERVLAPSNRSCRAAAASCSAPRSHRCVAHRLLRRDHRRAAHQRQHGAPPAPGVVLGTKLQFEPRRRGDIEFIFAPAQANTERLLRPQLRFHYAGDIPTYATSDAFEPDVRANEDLDGLMFPDMPWMLGGDLADAVHAAAREAWPTGGPHRGRLFAFGFDAFRLAQALRHAGATQR